MDVILVQDEDTESTAISLSVGVGSYQNPEAFPGLAHYLEHMLFLGTDKYPEPNNLQKYLKKHAGSANAYTARDHTNYFFQVAHDKFEPALDRFSEYFKTPRFDPDYSNKEINAVHSEWSNTRDQDGWILHYLRGLTANSEHPATRFSVGNRKSLTGASDQALRDAMLAFYERYYAANNMKLALVGRRTLDEQEALVRQYFEPVRSNGEPRSEITTPGLTDDETGQHIYYRSQKDLKQLVLEFAIPDNSEHWRLKANEYLAHMISSEEPGTLAQKLREDNLANVLTAHAEPDFYGSDGVFRINVDLTSKGLENKDQVVSAVFAYLDLLRQSGVTEEYYQELKQLEQRNFNVRDIPAPMEQAMSISRRLFQIPVPYVLSAPYRFEGFNDQRIQAVLAQLVPENLRLWHISQTAETNRDIPHHAGSYAVTPISEQDIQNWRQKASQLTFTLPAMNEFALAGDAPIVEPTLMDMTRIVDQPGAVAWLKHAEHHQGPKGFIRLVLNSPLGRRSAEDYVLGNLLKALYRDANTSLTDRAARAGINVDIDLSGETHQSIKLSGPNASHEDLLERLGTRFSSLDYDQADFEKMLDRFRREVKGHKRDAPYQQLFRYMRRLGQGFPWTNEEVIAASEKVTLEGLREYHQQLKQVAKVRVYAFGNYTEETVRRMVTNFEASLGEQRQPGIAQKPSYITPEKGELINLTRDVAHSDVALLEGFILPRESVETLAQLHLLNSVFSNAFYTELRTRQQLGYVVGSSPASIDEYPQFVLFIQSPGTPLTELKSHFDQFRQGYLEQLKALEPTAIEELKASVIAQFTQTPNDFSEEAQRLLHDFHNHNPAFDTRKRLLEGLKAATKQDLIALYEELLLGESAAKMRIQLRGSEFLDTSLISAE